MTVVGKTVSADLLVNNFDKMAGKYDSDYPEVKNPGALVQGIDAVMRAMGDGRIYDNTLIYILEDAQDEESPENCRYILMVTKGGTGASDGNVQFAVKLFYNQTGELESISTFEEGKVVWSPDNMTNTLHPLRTQYYMGFTYMLCEKSPGFDEELVPEKEVSVQELIELGVEGEIPAELIEISIDEEQKQGEEEQAQGEMEERESEASPTEQKEPIQDEFVEDTGEETDYATLIEDEISSMFDDGSAVVADAGTGAGAEDVSASEEAAEREEIAESNVESASEPQSQKEDDTEVIIMSPKEYEDEYDDLETDYEELFAD